jgi:hypothetical protein
MSKWTGKGAFHFWMAVAISFTAFLGFSFTYFGPLFRGEYPAVSPAVHVHGWSFFAWYLLFPLQAGLVRAKHLKLHRTLGAASVALAVVMVGTGLVVVGAQVEASRAPGAPQFWQLMGPGVFSTLILFTAFYLAALHNRRRGAYHKRLMILASAGALGAAAFRILGVLIGFGPSTAVLGILAPNLFVVAAMIRDALREGSVHRVYHYGLPISIAVEAGMMLSVPTPVGTALNAGLAWLGRVLGFLY